MPYNFYAFMDRMKYIKRWSLMRSVREENIMEHSQQVAMLAHALAVITNRLYGGSVDENKCVLYAVYHECSEVMTGDLPTPIKYFNSSIKGAYKDIEERACKKLYKVSRRAPLRQHRVRKSQKEHRRRPALAQSSRGGVLHAELHPVLSAHARRAREHRLIYCLQIRSVQRRWAAPRGEGHPPGFFGGGGGGAGLGGGVGGLRPPPPPDKTWGGAALPWAAPHRR